MCGGCASYPKHTFCNARGLCLCFNKAAGNICCASSLTWNCCTYRITLERKSWADGANCCVVLKQCL